MTNSPAGLALQEIPVSTTASFENFCRSNYAPIVRSLSLALNSVDLGQDAADEAFARAWQRWKQVSTMSNPGGWVYRVGLNWGRSFLRRRRREQTSPMAGLQSAACDPTIADPALAEAIASLTADHRAVIVAKFYLDWSEAEIATALNISPGTVKSRLSRALERLGKSTVRFQS